MSAELDFFPVNEAGRLRILKQYPDHWASVKTLYDSSDDFRSICYEYGLAVDALSKLTKQSGSEAVTRREEYSEIVSELELELLLYFNEFVM
jgi:hypothetical protein